MNNRYKVHARKRDTQNMEIHQTNDNKKDVKSEQQFENKILKKIETETETCQQNIEKKRVQGLVRNVAARAGEHYKIKDRR